MKTLKDYMIFTESDNEEAKQSETSDSDDFQDYLDKVYEAIEKVYEASDQLVEKASAVPDNDLSNSQAAVKDYILLLRQKLDETEAEKANINTQYSVNILK